jgi:phage-related minor tail protein
MAFSIVFLLHKFNNSGPTETSYNEHGQHIWKTWSNIVKTIQNFVKQVVNIVEHIVNIVKQVVNNRQHKL